MTRLFLTASLAALTACATPPAPEPMVDHVGFVEARPTEDPKPERVEIVETAIPLPLPGQLKPLEPEPAKKPALSPERAIEAGRAGAVIEPSPEGFLNAVQVYPYTEGALYRLYASPGQVTDIALQPGETLVSVSAGDTVRWPPDKPDDRHRPADLSPRTGIHPCHLYGRPLLALSAGRAGGPHRPQR